MIRSSWTVFGLVFTVAGVAGQGVHQPAAATETPAKWRLIGELGIGRAEDPVVATALSRMRGFIAAGVADGEDERWCAEAFMTEDTLVGVPLRFRFLRDARERGVMRDSPFLLFDYQKEIDFTAMFGRKHPQSVGGEVVRVMGMNLCAVERPGGGFRLQFGGRNIFGDRPAENSLLTTFTRVEAKAGNEPLMKRLRQLPIHASFDFRQVLNARESNELVGLFGPKAALVAGAISMLGKRPVLDLYSAMGPGDGIVGQYLDRNPGHARLLGNLAFEPGAILAADLGQAVPRSLLTLARAQPRGGDLRDALAPLMELLESWTGELNVVLTGASGPKPFAGKPEDLFEALGRSLEGVVVLGIEEGSGAEIVAGLEKFLGSDACKRSEFGVEAEVSELKQKSFRIGGPATRELGVRHVSLAANDRLFVLSVANSAATSLARRDGVFQKRRAVSMPKQFGLAQGPVKLWVREGLTRYVGVAYRAFRAFAIGSSVDHRADWVQVKLEEELFAETLAASLSWSRRFGVMLRLFF